MTDLRLRSHFRRRASNDYDDQNFVQLAEVQNGILREVNTGTDYNILGDELNRRTFDESGHYYTRDFLSTVHNSLNNGFGNRGIYNQIKPHIKEIHQVMISVSTRSLLV